MSATCADPIGKHSVSHLRPFLESMPKGIVFQHVLVSSSLIISLMLCMQSALLMPYISLTQILSPAVEGAF